MKKYRLKDRELQKKLEALDPKFGDRLQRGIKSSMNRILVEITIDLDCLETYQQQYDPNDWNNYPEVTPPYDIPMRVETNDGRGYKIHFHNFFEGGSWCYGNGMIIPKSLANDIKRFRPWE